MTAREQVEQVLRQNAVRPSGGCLPALLAAVLLAAVLGFGGMAEAGPPGSAAAHGPRGNGAHAAQSAAVFGFAAHAVSPQANAAAGAMIPGLAPAPLPTNVVQYVNSASLELAGVLYTDFRYRVDLQAGAAAATAPACQATALVTLCGSQVTHVRGLPATWTATLLTLDNIPVGASEFTVRLRGVYSARPVAYTLQVDDGRRYSGSSYGPTCEPTAVALAALGAQTASSSDLGYYALLLLLLGGVGMLLVAQARIRGK